MRERRYGARFLCRPRVSPSLLKWNAQSEAEVMWVNGYRQRIGIGDTVGDFGLCLSEYPIVDDPLV